RRSPDQEPGHAHRGRRVDLLLRRLVDGPLKEGLFKGDREGGYVWRVNLSYPCCSGLRPSKCSSSPSGRRSTAPSAASRPPPHTRQRSSSSHSGRGTAAFWAFPSGSPSCRFLP